MAATVTGFAQLRCAEQGFGRLVVVSGSQVFAPPSELAHQDLLGALRDWDVFGPLLRTWVPQRRLGTLTDTELDAPLTYPSKVICAGANYHDHLIEMGLPSPASGTEPYFFFKPPTTTMIGSGTEIPMPDHSGVRLDYEAELAVVIARSVRDVDPADALRHVAGYLVANDISDRGRFRREAPLGPPFVFDWIGHKGQDGFCPVSSVFVPSWQVPDPQSLGIRAWINGELRQHSSTSRMLVSVADQIAALSQVMTLEPGDLILTGTPAGVGAARGEFLSVGDEIRIEIDGLGELVNRVAAKIR